MSKSMIEFNFIVWTENGGEGWTWEGFDTIEEAVKQESWGAKKIVTRPVKYEIKEKPRAIQRRWMTYLKSVAEKTFILLNKPRQTSCV